ncbi:cyanophycin metabolism-associated DUF1854 family protein [Anatilimnocola floriformis]|uniref:cyanophycin metabolism-associated DUF1854 family protein n=1 Tax=Anatilimnocola floriformis TaxID=2948575 RepID=UPI0020C2EBFA|nr:DUF1854 domain-containing protein [Anatilimnocola floriformis]
MTQPMKNELAPNGTFGLARDAFGRLTLINADGERFVGVTPLRMFPFSDREHWISLTGPDNKELLLIEDLLALPSNLRKILEDELADLEFLPVIERVVHCSGDTEPSAWEVQTSRGPTHFVLKSEDDIRTLAPGKLLIVDAVGQRYLVPDFRKLDSYSRRILEEYA